MNQDQFLSFVRNIIGIGGGYAIGRGWLNSEQVTMLGGIAAAIIPFVWSFTAHTDSAKIKAVAALPDIRKIITVPDPKNPDVKAAATDTYQPKVTPAQ